MPRRTVFVALLLLVAGVVPVLSPPAAVAAPTTSTVSVVQAVKGLALDVYLDGSLLVPGFQPRTIAGPLTLSAADHRFQVYLPTTPAPSRPPALATPLIDSVIAIPAGIDLSLVIHPARAENATGLPVLSTFVNDTSFVGAGRSRLAVRHVANLGKVDITANDVAAATDLATGGHAETVVPEGTTPLVVKAAGTSTVALGPINVNVAAQKTVAAYVIANPDGSSPEIITQTVALEHTGNIQTATTRVVNAVVDTAVTVTVDNSLVFANVAPKAATAATELDYGDHTVRVTPAAGGAALATGRISVTGSKSVTIVVHVTADGSVAVTAFTDDTAALAVTTARLSVRNVSRLGALDVSLGGAAIATNLPAGSATSRATAPLANTPIAAQTAGTSTTVIAATPVSAAPGELVEVYLASGVSGATSSVAFVVGVTLDRGYRIIGAGGELSSYGAPNLAGPAVTSPSVDAVATPTGKGYWTVSATGVVQPAGDAARLGPTTALTLAAPIVDIAATPSGNGLWLVAGDGGVFSYGDAAFYGSTGGLKLNQPIVAMESTPTGKGYWLVASDGGVFSFGDAAFYGSTGGLKLNKPIVDMAASPGGLGYWLVASDGGIFSFGNADFWGSTGSIALNQPIVDFAPTPTGRGYWLVAADGGLFNFGNAPYYGSAVGASAVATVAIIG